MKKDECCDIEENGGDEEEDMMMKVTEGKVKYGISKTMSVVPEDTSVTAIQLVLRNCDDRSRECLIAASLTDYSIRVYEGNRMNKIATFKGHTKRITGLKFSDTNDNCLFSCSEDGTFRIWDLRKNSQVAHFQDDSDAGRLKPFCSFDVTRDDTYICCGTELIREDAFLLFWDFRFSYLLGGYWESHTDDITDVSFNPKDSNLVASGSTDGLINTFDISQFTEDDALLTTMNTESSADILRWYSESYSNIACLTHDETLQLWDANEASRLASFSRKDTESLFEVSSTIFVSLSTSQTGMLGVVSTSRTGETFLVEVEDNKTFVNHGVLGGAYTNPISAGCWDMENNYVVTCDESGLLCFWQPNVVRV